VRSDCRTNLDIGTQSLQSLRGSFQRWRRGPSVEPRSLVVLHFRRTVAGQTDTLEILRQPRGLLFGELAVGRDVPVPIKCPPGSHGACFRDTALQRMPLECRLTQTLHNEVEGLAQVRATGRDSVRGGDNRRVIDGGLVWQAGCSRGTRVAVGAGQVACIGQLQVQAFGLKHPNTLRLPLANRTGGVFLQRAGQRNQARRRAVRHAATPIRLELRHHLRVEGQGVAGQVNRTFRAMLQGKDREFRMQPAVTDVQEHLAFRLAARVCGQRARGDSGTASTWSVMTGERFRGGIARQGRDQGSRPADQT